MTGFVGRKGNAVSHVPLFIHLFTVTFELKVPRTFGLIFSVCMARWGTMATTCVPRLQVGERP